MCVCVGVGIWGEGPWILSYWNDLNFLPHDADPRKEACWKHFSCNVFYHIKENFAIQPFPKQAMVFMCLQYKSFENTVGKG